VRPVQSNFQPEAVIRVRTTRRHHLALIAFAVLTAGCGASRAAPSAVPQTEAPSQPASPRPSAPPRTLPPTGNTDATYPELTVSTDGPGYVIEIVDPTAKAWRIVVTGTGALATDRLELLVETGDIAPGVQVTTVIGGLTTDVNDLGGIVSTPTSAAGGCHPRLELCYSSGGIGIDLERGSVGVVLERLEGGAFTIVGATAGWPGEPFVLGPWRATDPLTTVAPA
jgi:hypothetical protein